MCVSVCVFSGDYDAQTIVMGMEHNNIKEQIAYRFAMSDDDVFCVCLRVVFFGCLAGGKIPFELLPLVQDGSTSNRQAIPTTWPSGVVSASSSN